MGERIFRHIGGSGKHTSQMNRSIDIDEYNPHDPAVEHSTRFELMLNGESVSYGMKAIATMWKSSTITSEKKR